MLIFSKTEMSARISDLGELPEEEYVSFMKDVVEQPLNNDLYLKLFRTFDGNYPTSTHQTRCQQIAEQCRAYLDPRLNMTFDGSIRVTIEVDDKKHTLRVSSPGKSMPVFSFVKHVYSKYYETNTPTVRSDWNVVHFSDNDGLLIAVHR